MGAKRLVPLSGVVAVVLIFAGFVTAGNTPKGTSSIAKVVAFYSKHSAAQTTSGVLLSLGALLFLVFSAAFAARIRSAHGAATLCLLGAGVLVAGLTTYAGLSIAMADVVGHVDGSALQALNVLADDAVFVFLITIGASAFLLGAAAAVFGTRSCRGGSVGGRSSSRSWARSQVTCSAGRSTTSVCPRSPGWASGH